MISWSNFNKWARRHQYEISKNGKEEVMKEGQGPGSSVGTPINTGRHNNPDGVLDRLLKEIAYRLGMSKAELEAEIG
ncbi:MAG TPA: hypothetical protein DCR27_05285 [Lachnospiraceae bacterium]|nr:hypothetical protein [Lachnospiraceae bacterium]